MVPGGLAFLVAGIATILVYPVPSFAQNGVTPGQTRIYSTIYSVGVEWDLSGDFNHNATVNVQYRIQGASAWKSALPLVRVDNTYNGNGFAGSILFLNPDTTYEVVLNLSDPDGGAENRILTVATRPLPMLPTGGRTFHVVPGSGGGDGSVTNPFKGIATAQAVAQPRDIFLVHAGSYSGRPTFSVPGVARNYIVWKGAGDGEALFVDGLNFGASHVWVEGLTVRNQAYATFSLNCPSDVVVRRNFFFYNHYSIYLQRGGEGWYIADNTIVGDVDPASGGLDGEGIELNGSFSACGANNHTVAHNSITRVADGISTPGTNVDIFGNDIFDVSVVGFDAVVGDVEDVVTKDVHVGARRGDPISDTGDAVVGDGMVVRATRRERPVQLDAFAVEAAACGVNIADDRVIGDVPPLAASLEIDAVVVVEEKVLAHDDIGWAVQREGGVGLIPDRQAFHPDMAGPEVQAIDEEGFAVSRAPPDDVVAGDPRHAEGRSPAVAPGVDEKDVTPGATA